MKRDKFSTVWVSRNVLNLHSMLIDLFYVQQLYTESITFGGFTLKGRTITRKEYSEAVNKVCETVVPAEYAALINGALLLVKNQMAINERMTGDYYGYTNSQTNRVTNHLTGAGKVIKFNFGSVL